MKKQKWIQDKNIILTGASSGMGKDLVKMLITKYNCNVLGIARSKEKMEKLQSLYVTLTSNVKVKDFFDKEVAFDVMLADIYKIMGEGLKDILD